MTDDPPKRPILRLAAGARPRLGATPAMVWKCKPCGAVIEIPETGDGDVRCGTCGARVGLAEDFRKDPPPLAKLRARQAKAKAPPAPKVVVAEVKRRVVRPPTSPFAPASRAKRPD